MKKTICLFLCVVIAAMLSGCKSGGGKNTPSADTVSEKNGRKDISLLYCRSDSFNPYSASTEINRELCKLLYEPLVKTDNNYVSQLRLAKTADLNGSECKIRLKSAVFSDGSAVTANDVIYSYNLAKASATVYAARFYEVKSIVAEGSDTVVFSLTRNDPYFLNLIDFPIIKEGSDKGTDSDGVNVPPVGCGRYVIADDKTSFELNSRFYGEKGEISKIKLIDAPDSDSVSHYVEVGAASIYYADLSDGNIVRMSGKRTDVNINSLVFIGINSGYGDLAGKYMRYAISSALDRQQICSNAYYNNAAPANGFFNPSLKDGLATQSLKSVQDIEISIENLDKIGYNRVASDGRRINAAGSAPSYTLLVNRENSSRVRAAQLIAKQLSAVGIGISVVEKNYEEYTSLLASGNFQLYIGEMNILPNMDISQLVLPGGSAAYGVGKEPPSVSEDGTVLPSPSEICSAAISNFYSGNASLSDVAGNLLTEMPQIPILYRKGILFYDSGIESGVKASQSDIYYSIENYKLTQMSPAS